MSGEPTDGSPPRRREPEFALPTARALLGQSIASGAVLATWWILCDRISGWAESRERALAIIIAVWAVQAGIWLAIAPWRIREGSTWMAWWMGATVGRLLITPAVVGLIYFPPPGTPWALLLAAATTYLVTLFVEVSIVASSLSGQFATRGQRAP